MWVRYPMVHFVRKVLYKPCGPKICSWREKERKFWGLEPPPPASAAPPAGSPLTASPLWGHRRGLATFAPKTNKGPEEHLTRRGEGGGVHLCRRFYTCGRRGERKQSIIVSICAGEVRFSVWCEGVNIGCTIGRFGVNIFGALMCWGRGYSWMIVTDR